MAVDFGNPISPDPLNRGLVLWYLGLGNQSGASIYNDLEQLAPATLTNGPLWDKDPGGFDCLSLDGTNDYATAGDINAVEGLTELSVCAWVNSNTLAGGTDGLRYICSKEDGGGLVWTLRQLTGGDKLQWFCADAGTTYGPQECTGFTANTWHYVVATMKAGVGLDLYIDGYESSPTGSAAIGTLTTNSAPLAIGSLPSTSGRAWSGLISDVRIVNRRYTQDEVWELYQDAVNGHPLLLDHCVIPPKFAGGGSGAPWDCSTAIGVTTSWQDRSTWVVSTGMVASADSGGSIPSSPPPSSVWACSTNVGVPTQSVTVQGILFPAVSSSIAVSTSCTISSIWAVQTFVGVSTAVTQGQNGRTNILAAGRYRR